MGIAIDENLNNEQKEVVKETLGNSYMLHPPTEDIMTALDKDKEISRILAKPNVSYFEEFRLNADESIVANRIVELKGAPKSA